MRSYTTKEGDTVDLIAWHEFGRTHKVTEAILAINAGLAAEGPMLPKGLTIHLPDTAPQVDKPTKRIWS